LYEEIRGKANLINPDPYVTGEDKFILKDFTPTFITPIISVLNPEAVVDKTKLKSSIPSFKLVREEEQLKRELEVAKAQQAAEAEVKSLLNKVEEITKKINEETKKKTGIMSALFKKETDVMKKLQDDQANILDMTKRKMRK
jgi:peptidoglycan hydrolase CwlO-like protein